MQSLSNDFLLRVFVTRFEVNISTLYDVDHTYVEGFEQYGDDPTCFRRCMRAIMSIRCGPVMKRTVLVHPFSCVSRYWTQMFTLLKRMIPVSVGYGTGQFMNKVRIDQFGHLYCKPEKIRFNTLMSGVERDFIRYNTLDRTNVKGDFFFYLTVSLPNQFLLRSRGVNYKFEEFKDINWDLLIEDSFLNWRELFADTVVEEIFIPSGAVFTKTKFRLFNISNFYMHMHQFSTTSKKRSKLDCWVRLHVLNSVAVVDLLSRELEVARLKLNDF